MAPAECVRLSQLIAGQQPLAQREDPNGRSFRLTARPRNSNFRSTDKSVDLSFMPNEPIVSWRRSCRDSQASSSADNKMRFVKRLLARRRRRQEKKILAYDVFQNESHGGRGTSDETSSTEGSRLVLASPWKAENFLENGRIREADWWESDEPDNDHDVTDDDDEEEEFSGRSETHSKQQTQLPRKFVNQGYSLWSQGRDAWKTCKSDEPIRRRDPAAIPDSFKRELVKCLGDRRQFELSQRIPLRTMIDAYQEVWNANPNE